MKIDTSVKELPKVGKVTAKALEKFGVFTVKDLLFHFPFRYLDFRKTIPIAESKEGETITIKGQLNDIQVRRSFKSRLTICEAIISDDSGAIKIIWFNQPYLANTLHKGDQLLLSGKVERYKTLQMTNPVYEKLSDETIHTGRLVPVYRTTETISNRTLRTLIFNCLPLATEIVDPLPKTVRKQCRLTDLSTAIQALHFPKTELDVKEARYRVAFDDVFPQQLAVALQQIELSNQKSHVVKPNIEKVKTFLSTLPFALTASQKRAAWDIFQDMESAGPMNRLLQGDVGSGKTIVAMLAMMQATGAKMQSALLAPTEILATQHYATFQKYLNGKFKIGLLTGNFATINGEEVSKQAFLSALAKGTIQMAMGTHALIQDKVAFKNLSLVVIDEQHRFGVGQRSLMALHSKVRPHLLSMTATPIPRTLALSVYGNLEVSTLKQVPSGRKSIVTKIVTDENRNKAYDFIRTQIKNGRQAFVITHRVEDTTKSEVRSAKLEYKRLSETVFPKNKVGLVYGKMKGADKDEVMREFNLGKFDILVATSVIEIGIDIPNASVILIEGAERFGLAQLHQLRGRVGRGAHQSYCFIFTTDPSQNDNERLQIFAQSNDGFALAELDLQQRGFGDLFGKQQTGFAFRFPQFITLPALKAAHVGAEALLHIDPDLKSSPELKQKADYYLSDYHGE